ncbi:DUF6350 family protein [Nocardioides sp. TF02-7]|uniref:cell division protein PerM n=1 Tax=Nocardioides sp. TF02-7 TaxID=2917724 RepID=UPI001F06D49F|nr:DUF6350 family protein [Nocardioides sp. TF02-7]UMG93348.1 DUF6350 family protein [Nocardioides sp. TF02-7]
MTSLHSPPAARAGAPARSEAELRRELSTRRPLVLTATLGGAVAAAAPLVVCMAAALVGWFVTDAGAHGSPSGALRVGALGWLTAHGSGVTVEGVRLTAVPLGLTLLCAWTVWRVGQRVGESVSGHGPDADRIADGERDWTVPVAGVVFAAGYTVVAVAATSLAATVETAPGVERVVLWSVLLSAAAGLPALARGSGRAAVWLPGVPPAARDALALCRSILVGWLAVATLTLLVALALDFSTAANIVSQLHTDAGDTALLGLLTLAVVPNAVLFASAYLLGPGFAVGTGTLVSPGAVVLGPLPMFPLLAALPDGGPIPGWAGWLMATPVLVAALAAARSLHRRPTRAWDRAAVRGCGGGLAAGLLLGLLTAVAGGSVGPGRMTDVGPATVDVVLHAVTAFGIGGLLGALGMTWWQLRGRGAARRLGRPGPATSLRRRPTH